MMMKVKELLATIRKILLMTRDEDMLLDDAHREYNRLIRRYKNELWRQVIRPTLNDNMDNEWVDDALSYLITIELLLNILVDDDEED